jgi:hypothetical protein
MVLVHIMHVPSVLQPVSKTAHQPFHTFYEQENRNKDKKKWQPVAVSAK